MKAPGFWWTPPGEPAWAARVMAPVAALFGLAAWWRRARTVPFVAPVPVICIGNLTAGGTGKTPMVALMLERLSARGIAAHVLLRGHAGREGRTAPHRVEIDRDDAAAVGDEALLHAALAPTWVARDRAAGVKAAVADGAQAIVLDDGLQNPGLAHDMTVVMLDAVQGLGNGRLIPAGPLREAPEPRLSTIDMAVLVGAAAARARALATWPQIAAADPVGAVFQPRETGLSLERVRVIAFAGIGRPEKFFETVEALGARLHRAEGFPDHYAYPDAVIRRLIGEAREANALLVTTEKDATRLSPALRREVVVVPVSLVLERPDRLDAALDTALERFYARHPTS
ncbi:MAG: tetraacyldisaccharide 4'-kinase [Pseudomonadota bacterium]